MGWGDELMVTGHVREQQRTDPRKVRIVYERPRWSTAWDHNPRIAAKGEAGDFQEYVARHDYLRPYIAAKSGEQWTWRAYPGGWGGGPPVGELYFTDTERAFAAPYAGRVILEPRLKPGASPNKDWGWARWDELATLLRARRIPYTQLGPIDSPLLKGAEWIETNSMRYAAAVMAVARAAVLPEGGLHHVAAAVGTPAVVLFGGYIAPAVTGYAAHRNLFVHTSAHPLGCGMRVACRHCRDAMAEIEPLAVLHHLEALLEERARRLAA